MNDLCHDLAFSWRNALKRPATSLLIIITLALGIGVTTAMFSVAYRVLVAPLPYADGDSLVVLEQNLTDAGVTNIGWSVPTLADYRAQNTVFSDLLGYVQLEYTLLGAGDPFFASTGIVNGDFFPVLGVQPVLGRGFVASDDVVGAVPVLMLGNEFWRTRFGADPAVVGRSLEMNDIVYTVIGVLPPYPRRNDVWVPWASDLQMSSPVMLSERVAEGWITHVIGKLHKGVSIDTAVNEVAAITGRLRAAFPDVYEPQFAISLTSLHQKLVGGSGAIFLMFAGLAAMVLLIASANVANLNLAKLAAREQELAIREAVGANPGRIARQLLAESLLQAFAGGVLGLLVAYPALRLLANFAANHTPLAQHISMNISALVIALALALGTGLLSGTATAFSGRNLHTALKEGSGQASPSPAASRKRQVFLLSQLALPYVMLVSSALVVLSLYRLQNEDPGYDADQVAVLNTQLYYNNYPNGQRVLAFIEQLTAAVAATPGIDSFAMAGDPVLQTQFFGPLVVQIEGRADSETPALAFPTIVTENYFEVLRIPLLKGRGFSASDDGEAEQVAIVNENFERRFFAATGALGQRIRSSGGNWRTIVGVVGNARSRALDQPDELMTYTNYRQYPSQLLNLYVRGQGSPRVLDEQIRSVIRAIDPELGVQSPGSLQDITSEWLAPRRLATGLTGLFALFALLVTVAGVAGVISYNVHWRQREIGIHMALGANPGKVLRLFVGQGLMACLYGLLLGLLLMPLLAPLLQPLLYRTSAFEPLVYATSALLLLLVVAIASYLPASRASTLKPMEALRGE